MVKPGPESNMNPFFQVPLERLALDLPKNRLIATLKNLAVGHAHRGANPGIKIFHVQVPLNNAISYIKPT